jgi:hypothetical protein
MESTESVLTRWHAQPVQELPAGRIKTDTAYQPRDPSIAPFRDRARLERESEQHIARLAEHLQDADLEPLLVADTGAGLYVVDGHHRLRAYKRAGRRPVPVRVLQITPEQARLVSKLVNCSGAKLALHAEQARECAWQTLAHITRRGRCPLPADTSARAIGRKFGTSHETVRAMLRKLPEVKPQDYGPTACDPGTGWPQWRYVKGNAIRARFEDVPLDQRERLQDERRAAKLAAMVERDGRDAFIRSVAILRDEALSAAAEELASALPPDSDDY